MTLGGDGTVNEAVNGLLGGAGNPGAGSARASAPGARRAGAAGPSAVGSAAGLGAGSASAAGGTGSGTSRGTPVRRDHGTLSDDPAAAGLVPPADADDLPALAALPGGNANVFTRSLGLPTDPVDAAARLIEDLMAGRERRIGLGIGNGRYFTFNAGLGLDAEVVRAVEGRRAHGRTLTPARYIRTALVQYYQVTDRRHAGHLHCRACRTMPGRPVSLHRLQLGTLDLSRPQACQHQPECKLRHGPGPAWLSPPGHDRNAADLAPDVYRACRAASRPERRRWSRPIGRPAQRDPAGRISAGW